MTTWLIASNNPYKTADLLACLTMAGIKALSYTDKYPKVDFPAEGTTSYQDNAVGKAQFLANLLQQPVIADDSGLELQALQDQFGVQTQRQLTAKHAKQPNLSDNAEILAALAPFTGADRTATMLTNLVAMVPGQVPIIATGTVTGVITTAARGRESKGFDKIFIPTGLTTTLAELPASQRLPLTHRGRAALALATALQQAGLN